MTTPSSLERLTQWLGPEAGPKLHRYLSDATRKQTGAPIWPDLDALIDGVIVPRFHSPVPVGPDVWFDIDAVDKFIRFCRLLPHIKGKWAGHRFELAMWQIIFVVAPLFGWKNKDGYRVFRTLYEETSKKQGKSTFGAALALFLVSADGEAGAEVVCAAGDKDQARAVYDVAKGMVKGAPALSKRLRPLKSEIRYEDKSSWFRCLSSEGALKAGLNLHGVIIDELLVQKTRLLVDNLEGATAAREQPIVAYVTTAGIDDPGSIYSEKRMYAQRIAEGNLEDPTWLTAIWTLDDEDDWHDESCWWKANPGLGISVSIEYLRKRFKQAVASPASQNTFLRECLNVRTGQLTRWLDITFLDKSGAAWLTPEEHNYKGKWAYLGLDLASTTDLAAMSIIIPEEMPNPDNRDEMITTLNWFLRAWTPGDTLEQRADRDQAPYQQWVDEGYLTVTDGNVIDYDFIEQEAMSFADRLQVQRLHFDRWGSKQILQHLRDGGLDVYEMGQGFASMSPAMKEMERQILLGRIRWGRNPLIRWSVQSLAVRQDPAGNIKPDRDRSTGRIDPFVSGVMALDAWARDDLGTSAYEHKGDDPLADIA